MLAFIPAQYSHLPTPHYWGPEPDATSYYQRLAAQHQHQAELALARARQARLQTLQRREIEQNAYIANFYDQKFGHPHLPLNVSAFSESDYSYSPIESLFTPWPRRADATLEAVRRRRTQEAKLRLQREQELKKAREQAFESLLESALVGLAREPEIEPSYQRRKVVRFSPIAPSTAFRSLSKALAHEGVSRPEPTPTTSKANSSPAQTNKDTFKTNAEPTEKFAIELWNALSSNRSEEEKEAILKAFGLAKPASAEARNVKAATTASEPTPVNTIPSAPEAPQDTSAITNEQERAKLLSAISTLEKKFNSLTSSFEFPAHIDFDAVSDDSDSHSASSLVSDAPSLSYTSTNKSLHTYENSLSNLLAKLDEVQSHGFDEVRSNRKRLVRAIEAELESLDNKKVEMWLKQQEKEKIEMLGDKVHIEWEPETTERPTTPAVAPVGKTAAAESSNEDTKPQDVPGPVPLEQIDEPVFLAVEMDNHAVDEEHQFQESSVPTIVIIPETNVASNMAGDEPSSVPQLLSEVDEMHTQATRNQSSLPSGSRK